MAFSSYRSILATNPPTPLPGGINMPGTRRHVNDHSLKVHTRDHRRRRRRPARERGETARASQRPGLTLASSMCRKEGRSCMVLWIGVTWNSLPWITPNAKFVAGRTLHGVRGGGGRTPEQDKRSRREGEQSTPWLTKPDFWHERRVHRGTARREKPCRCEAPPPTPASLVACRAVGSGER